MCVFHIQFSKSMRTTGETFTLRPVAAGGKERRAFSLLVPAIKINSKVKGSGQESPSHPGCG